MKPAKSYLKSVLVTDKMNRRQSLQWLALAASTLAVPSLFSASPVQIAAHAEYQPMVPKTGPTAKVAGASPVYEPWLPKAQKEPTQIIILNLNDDLKKGGKNQHTLSILYAAHILQGIINRQTTEKIFFKHTRIRKFDDVSDMGHGDPMQIMLDEGLLPYPHLNPPVNKQLEFPVLSYLFENYGNLLKGKVFAGSPGDDTTMGARCAAINAATFADLLYVPPKIDAYLKVNHRALYNKLELRYDLSKMDNAAAAKFTIAHFLNDKRRNSKVVNYHADGNPPTMVDYFIATYSICFFLEMKRKDEVPLLAQIMNKKYYPHGVPAIGPVEGGHAIQPLKELGYLAITGYAANASVTSAIRTDISTFRPPEPPKVLPIDANVAYISFNAPDGDSIDWMTHLVFANLRNDPARGKIPIAIRITPALIDISPTLYAWYTRQYPELLDLIFCMYDGGKPATQDGVDYWRDSHIHYLENCNGSLIGVNTFGGSISSTVQAFHSIIGKNIRMHYGIFKYQGDVGNSKMSYFVMDNYNVYSDQLGHNSPAKGYTPRTTADYFKDAINNSKPGAPCVLIAKITDDNDPVYPEWAHPRSKVVFAHEGHFMQTTGEKIYKMLLDYQEKGMIKRTIKLVPARDLAATYKAWKTGDGEPPSPTPAAWQAEPKLINSNSIEMTAATAQDKSGGIEYSFHCIGGGGNSSGWQPAATYTDRVLVPGNTYTYTVRVRDKIGNITGYSKAVSAVVK